jgi:hypothetical protein
MKSFSKQTHTIFKKKQIKTGVQPFFLKLQAG